MAAWDAFIRRYAPVIWASVRRTAGSGRPGRDDPGDLVQEVFLKLLRDGRRLLRSYDPARSSLPTWLSLVARSVAIDHLRRHRVRTVPIAEDCSRPDRTLRPAEEPVPVHLLTARQRLVLRMLFDEGMSVADAARVVGVDEQTIRSTKHKALCRLREHYLGAAGSGGGPPAAGDVAAAPGVEQTSGTVR